MPWVAHSQIFGLKFPKKICFHLALPIVTSKNLILLEANPLAFLTIFFIIQFSISKLEICMKQLLLMSVVLPNTWVWFFWIFLKMLFLLHFIEWEIVPSCSSYTSVGYDLVVVYHSFIHVFMEICNHLIPVIIYSHDSMAVYSSSVKNVLDA